MEPEPKELSPEEKISAINIRLTEYDTACRELDRNHSLNLDEIRSRNLSATEQYNMQSDVTEKFRKERLSLGEKLIDDIRKIIS